MCYSFVSHKTFWPNEASLFSQMLGLALIPIHFFDVCGRDCWIMSQLLIRSKEDDIQTFLIQVPKCVQRSHNS